jgi:predicted nucleic acid-binding protein
MPVASDTSPILGLSVFGLLELLKAQFDSVFIPQAVLEELKVETNFRGTSAIQNALKMAGFNLVMSKTSRWRRLLLLNWIKANQKQLHLQWIWEFK